MKEFPMTDAERPRFREPGSDRPVDLQDTLWSRGLESYALASRRAGQALVKCGGTWWREVRPCFFRPIFPFLDVSSGRVRLPYRSAFGGCQYPSYQGSDAPNSILGYIA